MTDLTKLQAKKELQKAYKNVLIAQANKIDKESINCYAITYRSIRTFSINIGLLSFNDLDRIEYDVKQELEQTTITKV